MSPELSYQFFKKLEKDHFCLIYMGEFDDELTATLMQVNEASFEKAKIFKKHISLLIAECFQNIIRHADKPEIIHTTNKKPKMFLVRNIGNVFYIGSTNLIENSKSTKLASKLNSINTVTPEELKADYLNALVKTGFPDKGFAGLGLIEMAKKSKSKLEFEFDFINFFHSNFFMLIRLFAQNKKKEDQEDAVSLKAVKELYTTMEKENILLIRKGDFSQHSIIPILDLIEGNLNSNKTLPPFKKKTLYLIIELLQNISKHAKENNGIREGIFMIASKNNQYTLNTGNYIDNNNVESFKSELENLANTDEGGLAEVYKNKLLHKNTDQSGNAGIGLIEISKYSKEKLKYNFMPYSATLSFFSLSITV